MKATDLLEKTSIPSYNEGKPFIPMIELMRVERKDNKDFLKLPIANLLSCGEIVAISLTKPFQEEPSYTLYYDTNYHSFSVIVFGKIEDAQYQYEMFKLLESWNMI